MRLLITRPQADARESALFAEGLGHKAIISPVMEVNCTRAPLPHEAFLHGVVITSRNALRCLERTWDLPDYCQLPLFAVGKNSAEHAKSYGFKRIITGPGRARDLLPLIKSEFEGIQRPQLYHPGGAKKAFDLKAPLDKMGIKLIEQTVYETRPSENLSPEAIKAIATQSLDAIILMSPQTAKYFHALIRKNQLEENMSTISCFCLSKKVADALEQMPCKEKLIAAEPNLEGVFKLIGSGKLMRKN